MSFFIVFATAILTFHAADSYILLTANLEDVQAIAKQLSHSPISEQLTQVFRRAYSTKNQDPEFKEQPQKEEPKVADFATMDYGVKHDEQDFQSTVHQQQKQQRASSRYISPKSR